MSLSKNHRFGLIVFVILSIATYLVTVEPWKITTGNLRSSMVPESPPANLMIAWNSLETGYPKTNTTDTILSYEGFDIGYSEQFEQASWVAYVLTRAEVDSGSVERTDNFQPDLSIASGSASLKDYRGSGFDRGHLAPAADMKWNRQAMNESFLMSNMSPQVPSFNRGVWNRLERQVRRWALQKDSLYVISGPVLQSITSFIGDNQVGVPGSYFKVVVDLSPPDHDFIAFLLPNTRSSANLHDYAITVDSLEKVTGYDFFAAAPDQAVVDWLEKQLNLDTWN